MHLGTLTQKTEKLAFAKTLTHANKLDGAITDKTPLFTFMVLRVSDLTASPTFWRVLIVGQGA